MRASFIGLVPLVLVVLLVLAGCQDLPGGFCNPLSQKSATVVMQGEATIAIPSPVTLNGVAIGEVKKATLDANGRACLELCLDKEHVKRLDKLAVFYIEPAAQGQSGGDRLVCQTFPEENAPPNEELRFLGFDSYASFLSWRAQNIMKKGLDGFLKALDEALDKVNK